MTKVEFEVIVPECYVSECECNECKETCDCPCEKCDPDYDPEEDSDVESESDYDSDDSMDDVYEDCGLSRREKKQLQDQLSILIEEAETMESDSELPPDPVQM